MNLRFYSIIIEIVLGIGGLLGLINMAAYKKVDRIRQLIIILGLAAVLLLFVTYEFYTQRILKSSLYAF